MLFVGMKRVYACFGRFHTWWQEPSSVGDACLVGRSRAIAAVTLAPLFPCKRRNENAEA